MSGRMEQSHSVSDSLHDNAEVAGREEDLVELDNVGVLAEGECLMVEDLPQHVFVEGGVLSSWDVFDGNGTVAVSSVEC